MIEQFFESNDNNIKLKDFLNTDMLDYAKYDNTRSIPKLTDGFKDSQRKAVYGLIKFCNNQQLKVSQLGEMTSEKTNYLHGGESLQGAIALMAQDYNGSNNYPLFLKMVSLVIVYHLILLHIDIFLCLNTKILIN